MQDKIVIGEILKPQGIRGELKIKPLLDDVALVKKFRKVYIGGAEYKVLSARYDTGAAYLALSGVADRNAAELLRGKEVEALRADAPALNINISARLRRHFLRAVEQHAVCEHIVCFIPEHGISSASSVFALSYHTAPRPANGFFAHFVHSAQFRADIV